MSEVEPEFQEPDLAERALRRKKREDAALVLPVFGVLLLVSPFLNIVHSLDQAFGIPSVVFYIFSTWVVLIALSARLAKLLKDD